MTHSADMRPHLTDARVGANRTYLRRRARSAVDMLIDIDPTAWDEHTRRMVTFTLPMLARIEPWELEELRVRRARPIDDVDQDAPTSWAAAGIAAFDERFPGGRNPVDERDPLAPAQCTAVHDNGADYHA